MDLAEIKKWRQMPNWNVVFRSTTTEHVDWLIAEVERQTNQLDRLQNEYADKFDAQSQYIDTLIEAKNKALSSLTRSKAEGRREGLEEAVKVLEGMKAYCEQKSLDAQLGVVDNAWQQAAYEVELGIAAIRQQAQEN